ncbi:MAG: hypothetical protein L3J83_03640 [Proteobacteria bacterium]|nr:hypothetical protein [Pseudomonadota bacterium]
MKKILIIWCLMLVVSNQVQAAKPESEVANNMVNENGNKIVNEMVKPTPYTSSWTQNLFWQKVNIEIVELKQRRGNFVF